MHLSIYIAILFFGHLCSALPPLLSSVYSSTLNGVFPQKSAHLLPASPSQISLPLKPYYLQEPHIFPCLRSEPVRIGRSRAEDAEISIFNAERYFNENQFTNVTPSSTKRSSSSTADIIPASQSFNLSPKFRSRSFRAAPTPSSDASWNSQAELLRKPAYGEKRKAPSSPAGRFFYHIFLCFGRKSAAVEDNRSSDSKNFAIAKSATIKTEQKMRARTAEISRRIADGFSFPYLSPRKDNSGEDPVRVSLEVFRPPETLAPLTKSPFGCAVEDDAASDTSSDLFEIQSFSTQVGVRRKDSFDELSSSLFGQKKLAESEEAATPSIAPSECYPPSEVSVDWSITTADGLDRSTAANFSSSVSDYEQLCYAAAALGGGKKKFSGCGGGSGFLGCRSERAVSVVGPNAAWFGPESQFRLGNAVPSVGLERVMASFHISVFSTLY